MITFEGPDEHLNELAEVFFSLPTEDAIFMSHYELANETGISAQRWKEFIVHPKVDSWISQELYLFKKYQFKNMIKEVSDSSRSVGAAQMMNALNKVLNESSNKEGPFIIYSYVPPLPDQEEGSTVTTVRLDKSEEMKILL